MDIFAAPELQKLVRSKIGNRDGAKSGSFCPNDPERDGWELAERILTERVGPYSVHDPNEFKKTSEQIVSELRGRK
jgi:hypothetical protein